MNICQDCSKKLLTNTAKRCNSCENKRRGKLGLCINGKHHYNWQGGIRKSRGYISIYVPLHPNSNIRTKIIREHRLVIEADLNNVSFDKWIRFGQIEGYPKKSKFLQRKNIVHHLNGNRGDNRLENLTITTRNKHEYQTLLKISKQRINYLEHLLNKENNIDKTA